MKKSYGVTGFTQGTAIVLSLCLVAPSLPAGNVRRETPFSSVAQSFRGEVFCTQALVESVAFMRHPLVRSVPIRVRRNVARYAPLVLPANSALGGLGFLAPIVQNLAPALVSIFGGTAVHDSAALFASGLPFVASSLSSMSIRRDPREELDRVLASHRGLIFSSNADAIGAALFEKAHSLERSYLRLTLRDQTDLDRLTTRITARNGKPVRGEGPLRELIREGGILFIDYGHSDPKLVESLNSLFDRDPYFDGVTASPSLDVVGVVSDAQLNDYSGAFYSRFERITSIEMPFQDPLEAIRPFDPSQAEGQPVVRVPLFEGPSAREQLLGQLQFQPNGLMVWTESALLKAGSGVLVIEDGPWSDPAFVSLMREILTTRQFEVNGRIHSLPKELQIYRHETDFSKGIKDKTIFPIGKSEGTELLWIINRTTQDELFRRTVVNDNGGLEGHEGLLDEARVRPLRLRITEALDEWVWHRLMHSVGTVTVEVAPGVVIPTAYESLAPHSWTHASPDLTTESLDQALQAKSAFIETGDPGYLTALIRDRVGADHTVVYPITPETTLSDLVASLDLVQVKNQMPSFSTDRKGVIQALQTGKTVILEGIEHNPELARKLETALTERPYLFHHHQGGELAGMSGRLLVVSGDPGRLKIAAAHRVREMVDEAVLAKALQKRFPHRFRADEFKKVMMLKRAFETIPPPFRPGLYPRKPPFHFDRLSLLYGFRVSSEVSDPEAVDWLEAFEQVFLSLYADSPDVSAFMRTQVRLAFQQEERGRKPHTVVGHKLHQALNRLIPHEDPKRHLWELADALSLEDLNSLHFPSFYNEMSGTALRNVIDRALIKGATGEREAWYRYRAGIDGEVSDAPTIDMQSAVGVPSWEEQVQAVARAFTVTPLVMLQGLPGLGKSHVAHLMGPLLGYQESEIVGPITIGSDVSESDVISRRVLKNNRTVHWDEAVAEWAHKKEGGLLVVDEANLATPAFWNFLNGLFEAEPKVWVNGHAVSLSSRHRVIFTGNQPFVQGRQELDVVMRHAITVHFSRFSDAFLLERIEDILGFEKDIQRRQTLKTLVLRLHRLFERMGRETTFSLRDIQELVARLQILVGTEWTPEAVVGTAWDQYKGNFDASQQRALSLLLAETFGFSVVEWEASKTKAIRAQWGDAFKQNRLTIVPTVAQMTSAIVELFAMREARAKGQTVLQGKRGLFLDGPSGRGKDAVLDLVANSLGLISYREAPAGTPPTKLFYHITARPDNQHELIETLQRAKREGSLVIISELNLLNSSFVEGRLNDVLTGSAHPGFAFIATVNSDLFTGREKFSSALLNRVVYRREPPYSENEWIDIVTDQVATSVPQGRVSAEEIRHAVRLHLWITDSVEDPSLRPTSRELIRLVSLWAQKPSVLPTERAEELLYQIYGPFYLEKALGRFELPSQQWLLHSYRPKTGVSNGRVLELHADAVVPSAKPAVARFHGAIPKNGISGMGRTNAFYSTKENAYSFHADVFERGEWEASLLHEEGHGRRTRDIEDLTPAPWDPLDPLFQDLEDLRQLHGLALDLPAASMLDTSSQGSKIFAELVKSRSRRDLKQWAESGERDAQPRRVFSSVLMAFAHGLVTREEVVRFASVAGSVWPINPIEAAVPFLELALEIRRAVAVVEEEEEHLFQQYRMLHRLRAMQEAYNHLPLLPSKAEAASRVDQDKVVDRAIEALEQVDLQPTLAEPLPVKESVQQVLLPRGPQRGYRIFLDWLRDVLRPRATFTAPQVESKEEHQEVDYGAGTHGVDDLSDVHSKPIVPRLSQRVDVSYIDRTPSVREPFWEKVSGTIALELKEALSNLVTRRLVEKRVYGSEGPIDPERLLLTMDPTRSGVRSGGRYVERRKEIVLIPQVLNISALRSALGREMILHLLSEGFTFTVYTPAGDYVDGIDSYSLLSAVFPDKTPALDVIEADLARRLPRGSYVVTSLDDLLSRVERYYAYGAFKVAMQPVAKEQEHDQASEAHTLQDLLHAWGTAPEALKEEISATGRSGYRLDLRLVKPEGMLIEEFDRLVRMPGAEKIHSIIIEFEGFTMFDLRKLKNLEQVVVSDMDGFSSEQHYRYAKRVLPVHPNRRNLVILMDSQEEGIRRIDQSALDHFDRAQTQESMAQLRHLLRDRDPDSFKMHTTDEGRFFNLVIDDLTLDEALLWPALPRLSGIQINRADKALQMAPIVLSRHPDLLRVKGGFDSRRAATAYYRERQNHGLLLGHLVKQGKPSLLGWDPEGLDLGLTQEKFFDQILFLKQFLLKHQLPFDRLWWDFSSMSISFDLKAVTTEIIEDFFSRDHDLPFLNRLNIAGSPCPVSPLIRLPGLEVLFADAKWSEGHLEALEKLPRLQAIVVSGIGKTEAERMSRRLEHFSSRELPLRVYEKLKFGAMNYPDRPQSPSYQRPLSANEVYAALREYFVGRGLASDFSAGMYFEKPKRNQVWINLQGLTNDKALSFLWDMPTEACNSLDELRLSKVGPDELSTLVRFRGLRTLVSQSPIDPSTANELFKILPHLEHWPTPQAKAVRHQEAVAPLVGGYQSEADVILHSLSDLYASILSPVKTWPQVRARFAAEGLADSFDALMAKVMGKSLEEAKAYLDHLSPSPEASGSSMAMPSQKRTTKPQKSIRSGVAWKGALEEVLFTGVLLNVAAAALIPHAQVLLGPFLIISGIRMLSFLSWHTAPKAFDEEDRLVPVRSYSWSLIHLALMSLELSAIGSGVYWLLRENPILAGAAATAAAMLAHGLYNRIAPAGWTLGLARKPSQNAPLSKGRLIEAIEQLMFRIERPSSDARGEAKVALRSLKRMDERHWLNIRLSESVRANGQDLIETSPGDWTDMKLYIKLRFFNYALNSANLLVTELQGLTDEDRVWLERPQADDDLSVRVRRAMGALVGRTASTAHTLAQRAESGILLHDFVRDLLPRRGSVRAVTEFLVDRATPLLKELRVSPGLDRLFTALQNENREKWSQLVFVEAGDRLPWLAVGETQTLLPSFRSYRLKDRVGGDRTVILVSVDPSRPFDCFASVVAALASVRSPAPAVEPVSTFQEQVAQGASELFKRRLVLDRLRSPMRQEIVALAEQQWARFRSRPLEDDVELRVTRLLDVSDESVRSSKALVEKALAGLGVKPNTVRYDTLVVAMSAGDLSGLRVGLGAWRFPLLTETEVELPSLGNAQDDRIAEDIVYDLLLSYVLFSHADAMSADWRNRLQYFFSQVGPHVISRLEWLRDHVAGHDLVNDFRGPAFEFLEDLGRQFLWGQISEETFDERLGQWSSTGNAFESASVSRLPKAWKWVGIPSLVWFEEAVHLLVNFGVGREGLRQVVRQRRGLYSGRLEGGKRPVAAGAAGPGVTALVALGLLAGPPIAATVGLMTLVRLVVDVALAFHLPHHELHPLFHSLRSAA